MEHVTTMSNSNASCFRVGLSWVELRWVLTILGAKYFLLSVVPFLNIGNFSESIKLVDNYTITIAGRIKGRFNIIK